MPKNIRFGSRLNRNLYFCVMAKRRRKLPAPLQQVTFFTRLSNDTRHKSTGNPRQQHDHRCTFARHLEVCHPPHLRLPPATDVSHHRRSHRRALDWRRCIGCRGRVEQHHVPHHGLLQRFLRRLRYPRSAGLWRRRLPQDALLCEQCLAHSSGAGRGHHAAFMRAVRPHPETRQHAGRHLPRRLRVPIPAVLHHPFHHRLQPLCRADPRLGQLQTALLFPHRLVTA